MGRGKRRLHADMDLQGNRLLNVGTLVPSTTTAVLDFDDDVDNVQKITIGLATTFTTANLAAGRTKEVFITCSAVSAFSWPAGWIWYGGKPLLSVLAKEIRLRLRCYGSTDETVRVDVAVQA